MDTLRPTVPSQGVPARLGPVGPLAAAAGAAAGVPYLMTHDPAQGGAYLRCPLHSMTGLWCPGCGLTRAVYKLAHGNVIGALGSNLLIPLVVGAVVVGWWSWWQVSRRRSTPRWPARIPNAWWAGLLAAVVVFGLLRNLSPFAALAP